jgi:hypothetical protein
MMTFSILHHFSPLFNTRQMKQLFHISLQFLAVVLLLTACKKEGEQGPQGPQGPSGNPGASSSGGGGSNSAVRAYVMNKPLEWQYFTAGGSSWLVFQGYKYEPQDLVYYISDVKPEDVTLVYLQLASGAGNFWVGLPYAFQTGSPARTETYRILEEENNESIYRFRITADLMNTKVPFYKATGMRVIIIPSSEDGTLGEEERSVQSLSLENLLEKYKLQEKDFKSLSY